MDDKKILQKERGDRLKNIRGVANISRLDMSNIVGISVHTLKSWELGKLGGISEKGATMVSNALREFKKINCNPDWIMHGKGSFPSLCADHEYGNSHIVKVDDKSVFLQVSSDNYILPIGENIYAPSLIKGNDVGVSKISKINEECLGRYMHIELINEEVFVGIVANVSDKDIIISSQDNLYTIKVNNILRQGKIKRIYIT